MDSPQQLHYHSQNGPYEQRAVIKVKDGGNGLPITMAFITGDPQSSTSNSMSISMAKLYRDQLTAGIEAAERGGLRDAGF